jgi:hypothetical protein
MASLAILFLRGSARKTSARTKAQAKAGKSKSSHGAESKSKQRTASVID